MSRRFLARANALACGAFLLCCVLFGPWTPSVPAESGKDVFGTTKVWAVHLEIPVKEYEAMQPPAGGFGFPGAPPMPPQAKDKRDSERNLFDTEFPWAQGELTAEGKMYKKIGIR
jgi:hypothetical protein